MGAFLTAPNTKKHSCSGSGSHEHITYHYGASCMQGWRVEMEDAHCSLPILDKDTALFAVYDGHGGKEVALYCRDKLPNKLKSHPEFLSGRIGAALQKIFLELDDDVRGDQALSEMRQLLRKEDRSPKEGGALDSSSDDEDYKPTEDEELMLRQEAEIPLEDIIAQFAPNGASRKDMLRAFLEQGLEESTSEGTGEDTGEESVPSESDTLSENESASSPSPSHDKNKNKSPSLPQPTNGILKNKSNVNNSEDAKPSSEIFGLDASSNLGFPSLQNNSLPSPIKSPDKLSPTDESHDPELEETEATLKRELEEQDRTPLLPESESSEEEQAANSDLKKPLYKLTRKNKMEGFESGTTAVVCVLYKGEIIVANAGDSRCVLSRQGEAYPLSFDHKPTDRQELERIKRAGGTVGQDGRVNAGLNLSRAIGDHTYKVNKELSLQDQMISAMPDINCTTLQPGDNFILLACDGIFNVMDNQEAITFVQNRLDQINLSKEGPSALARICEELCDGCLATDTNSDGSGCDNMTVVIVVPDTTSSNPNYSRKRKSSENTDSAKKLKSDSLDS